MPFEADLHVLYKIANAPVNAFPFPHIYVRDIFPPEYYRELRDHLPPAEQFRKLTSLNRVSDDYPDSRLVLLLTPEHLSALPEPYRAFWEQLASWMLGGDFGETKRVGGCAQQRRHVRMADHLNSRETAQSAARQHQRAAGHQCVKRAPKANEWAE